MAYCILKQEIKETDNLFGTIEDIKGAKLKIIDRSKDGDCLCLLPSKEGDSKGLIDVHAVDVETIEEDPFQNVNLFSSIINTLLEIENNH